MPHHNRTPASILEAPKLRPEWIAVNPLIEVVGRIGDRREVRRVAANRAYRRSTRATARASTPAAIYTPHRKESAS